MNTGQLSHMQRVWLKLVRTCLQLTLKVMKFGAHVACLFNVFFFNSLWKYNLYMEK